MASLFQAEGPMPKSGWQIVAILLLYLAAYKFRFDSSIPKISYNFKLTHDVKTVLEFALPNSKLHSYTPMFY